jgi:hypothetical protein
MYQGEMIFFNKPKEIFSRKQIAEDVSVVKTASLENHIDENDFIDDKKEGYTARDVFNDHKMVATMEEKFERDEEEKPAHDRERHKETKDLSEALEIAVMAGGQKAKWFGNESHLIRSARFDDIFNGVDGFLEFPMEDGEPFRMALAIDASMSKDKEIIEKKMTRGIKKLETGHMEVKYFKSKVNDYKGKLTTVLPIVLGIESHNAQKLIHLFAEVQRVEGDEQKMKKVEKSLQDDPSQIIFLKEILVQLDMYAKLFRREGSHTRYAVEKMHSMIETILKNKSHIDSDEIEENDCVFSLISEIAERKKNEYQTHRSANHK